MVVMEFELRGKWLSAVRVEGEWIGSELGRKGTYLSVFQEKRKTSKMSKHTRVCMCARAYVCASICFIGLCPRGVVSLGGVVAIV